MRGGVQWHLRASMRPELLDKTMPGLGRGWEDILGGTTTNVLHQMVVHVAQWEAVAARWAEDDYTQLQPTEPCWIGPANRLLTAMMQTVQAKELELCARLCMPPLSIARSLANSLGKAKRSSNAAVIRLARHPQAWHGREHKH